jgi:hypothetical protein
MLITSTEQTRVSRSEEQENKKGRASFTAKDGHGAGGSSAGYPWSMAHSIIQTRSLQTARNSKEVQSVPAESVTASLFAWQAQKSRENTRNGWGAWEKVS